MDFKSQTLKTEIITVTPKLAAEMLEQNTSNRPVSKRKVDHYAESMRKDEWKVTNDNISFDTNGALANGQHRLWAVLESGVPIEIGVSFGLSPESFLVMDQGNPRSYGDAFSVAGILNSTKVGNVCRELARFRRGPFVVNTAVYHVTHHDALNEYRLDEQAIQESVLFVERNRVSPVLVSGTLMACSLYLYRRRDAALADDYATKLLTGLGILDRNEPASRMRDRMISESSSSQRSPIGSVRALLFKSWNKHMEGGKIRHLRWSDAEEYPQPSVPALPPLK